MKVFIAGASGVLGRGLIRHLVARGHSVIGQVRSAKAEGAVREAATVADLEAFFAHLEASAVASGFLDPARPGRFMERMRRLFARCGVEREEAKLFRGLLAAFERRMKKG